MFLRRLSASGAAVHRRADDGGVLAALRSELAHELSSSASASSPSPLQRIGDFDAVLDAPRAQDVLLCRRRGAAEEEVLVSALLAPLQFRGGDPLPRDALVKVFVRKPRVTPLLRFDCRVSARQGVERLPDAAVAADFAVTSVCYHPFPGDARDRKYQGPEFISLDLQLQVALKEYLVARGINSELASSLLHHLLQKEHAQYVNWLETLEDMFATDN